MKFLCKTETKEKRLSIDGQKNFSVYCSTDKYFQVESKYNWTTLEIGGKKTVKFNVSNVTMTHFYIFLDKKHGAKIEKQCQTTKKKEKNQRIIFSWCKSPSAKDQFSSLRFRSIIFY